MGSIPSDAGIVATSLAGSNAITLDGHGFETDDLVNVRALEGGTLSAPLDATVTYYAIRITSSTFQLSLTAGGAAIDLTTDAVSMLVSRDPDFDYWIGFYSRWADTSLPGHLVPMTAPVPSVVEGLVADLVAKRMFGVGGQASDTLQAVEIASAAQLARFGTGMPVRDAAATASANLAVTTDMRATADPRGWGSGSLP